MTNLSPPAPEFLTTGQIASYCGVNFRTVIRWIKKGYIEAARLPGRGDHRVTAAEFVRFLEKNELSIPEVFKSTQGPKSTPTPQSYKVLIVDDDVPVAKSIERTLKMKGYQTQISNDGFEAGLSVETFKPQLITLDLNMPSLSGLSVLKALKQNGKLSELKVLIISGGNEMDIDQALAHGASGYLKKPFHNDELTETLSRILSVPNVTR